MTRTFDPTLESGARAGQRSQERRPDTADVYLLARQMQSQAMANATAWAVKGIGRQIARAARSILAYVQTARARKRTLDELSRLDARSLRDIGIDPYNVEAAVDTLFAEDSGDQKHSSLDAAVRQVDQLVAPLRRWDLSRRAAGQMARMNRETLDDLGYVKGDVDWVPEDLAERRVHGTPANGDGGRKKAA